MFLFLFLIYFIFLLLRFSSRNIIILLLLIEVLSWRFTLILTSSLIIKYLIIQRYFIILSLIGLTNIPRILMLALIIKLGFPPYHLWMIALFTKVTAFVIRFAITIHKWLPLIVIGRYFSVINSFSIVLICIIKGILLISVQNIVVIFIFSSIVHSAWLLVAYKLRISFILIYLVLYNLLYTLLVSSTRSYTKISRTFQRSSTSFLWLIISGIPPLLLFFIKLSLLTLLIEFRALIRSILIIVAVINLVSYYRVFHLSLQRGLIVKPITYLLVVSRCSSYIFI